MLRVLSDRTYRRLFAAQIVSLVGTGLATVALGLLAYDLAGGRAGAVLGTALAIKMVAYVAIAPVAAAFADRVPRRTMLAALDLVRAAVALALPFVGAVWQVYVLIFLLQAASAGFTPTFQATIPDILRDERDYTRALSLSRLAYDLERLLSPMLAAALLLIIDFHALFGGTALGFVVSAALVLSERLPRPAASRPGSVGERTTSGVRRFLATPRLRGLLALNLAVAAAGAMVIVNTVVIVQAGFGLGSSAVAVALGAFGAGSMVAALALPQALERAGDRPAMLAGAGLLAIAMALGPLADGLRALLPLWFAARLASSLVQTPTGRLLRRSAHPEDRPALFAAQFALSHACWLVTYPLAGHLGAGLGLGPTFLVLAATALGGMVAAGRLWPAGDREVVPHDHARLACDDPHLAAVPADARGRHAHPFVIDRLHPAWAQGV